MTVRFYHARSEPLKVGTDLCYGHRLIMKSEPESKVDDLFELIRKGRSFNRNTAVFMIGLPAERTVAAANFDHIGVQSTRYIYELAPQSAQRHDWYWARELHARHPPTILVNGEPWKLRSLQPDIVYAGVEDQEIVERYWAGEESYSGRWEYLSDVARVVACLRSPETTSSS